MRSLYLSLLAAVLLANVVLLVAVNVLVTAPSGNDPAKPGGSDATVLMWSPAVDNYPK